MNDAQPTVLTTMMGTYPKTAPLKEGAIAAPELRLDFAPVDTAQKAFKDVVREEKYEVAELAIITFLQAFDAGKPYRLLPFAINGHFHHKSLLRRASSALRVEELAGKRVAMRAYSQTTPTWVRGILADEYGIALDSVRWLSQEGAHVANYEEPPWVTRLDSKLGLEELLLAGEVDAIIAGGVIANPDDVVPVIPDAQAAALAWNARTGVVPINHIVTIREEIAAQRPDLVRALYDLLNRARAQAEPGAKLGPDLQPVGFDALRPSLETALRFAHEQRLITKNRSVDELYGSVAKALT